MTAVAVTIAQFNSIAWNITRGVVALALIGGVGYFLKKR